MNLEIIIPTWNRFKYLERTLSQFANSPFKNCKITIIDNASTDNTPQVCEKYKNIFPNLKVIKNNKNIGLSANILRCYEIAEEKYMWLVGDNDNYDFSDCSEVIDALENSNYDVIFIQGNELTNLRRTTVNELYENGDKTFIGSMATISKYILKSELFTSDCLQEGYTISKYLYPQFALIKKACDENFSIFISSKTWRIADKNPNVSYNTLELVNGWVSSSLILEKKYYKEFIKKFLGNSLIYTIIGAIVSVKAHDVTNYRETLNDLIISIIRGKGILIGLIYAIIMLLVSLIPKKIAKYILNRYNTKNDLPIIN